ncbi:allantoate amidohydrolase [Thalassospira profundimaris]|uniref:allantoate amidohydrolase n=1 Tax=Thalassospira profundimaris TaxID=502049 RepID=UPI000DED4E81|nr:allantoate amidohydrolase [Thalassospira profundimaris]
MLGQLVYDRLEQAAQFSQPGPGVTRLFLSAEHKQVAALINEWMKQAGLEPDMDAAGNIVGRDEKARNGAPTLIMGSHQDTVVSGGKYDGMLGVALPIAVVGDLYKRKIDLPFGIEIVAFGDEEGTRFQSTLVGSRALAGTFDPAALDATDDNGVTVRTALQDFGCNPDHIPGLKRSRKNTLGFLEVHIEQGPVLEGHDLPVGIVTALTGIERHRVLIKGKASHAGTTPMDHRQDALLAAADIVHKVNQVCRETEGMVGVVGKLEVSPNAVNVIPDSVDLTIELRAPERAVRVNGRGAILSALGGIAQNRSVAINTDHTYEAEGVPCADWMMNGLEAAITQHNIRPLRLFSGAGHDGLAMHDLCDIGMLFVRCKDGLSHHPDEAITAEDANIAAQVLTTYLQNLAQFCPKLTG